MRFMQKVDVRGQYAKTHGYKMKSLIFWLRESKLNWLKFLGLCKHKFFPLIAECLAAAAAGGGRVGVDSSCELAVSRSEGSR